MATIRYDYGSGTIRNQPVTDQLSAAIQAAANAAGIDEVVVFSGGQAAAGEGGNRTGSTRHDHGNAADVKLMVGGRLLDHTNPSDQRIFATFVQAAQQQGLTGFGAGPGYMDNNSIHVGYGDAAVWGAGGAGANAPSWLRNAYSGGSPGPVPPAPIPNAPSNNRGQMIVAGEQIGNPNAYVIKPGDNLTKIADQFGTTVPELVRLNNIRNPNVIIAGETLTLPGQQSGSRPQLGDRLRAFRDALAQGKSAVEAFQMARTGGPGPQQRPLQPGDIENPPQPQTRPQVGVAPTGRTGAVESAPAPQMRPSTPPQGSRAPSIANYGPSNMAWPSLPEQASVNGFAPRLPTPGTSYASALDAPYSLPASTPPIAPHDAARFGTTTDVPQSGYPTNTIASLPDFGGMSPDDIFQYGMDNHFQLSPNQYDAVSQAWRESRDAHWDRKDQTRPTSGFQFAVGGNAPASPPHPPLADTMQFALGYPSTSPQLGRSEQEMAAQRAQQDQALAQSMATINALRQDRPVSGFLRLWRRQHAHSGGDTGRRLVRRSHARSVAWSNGTTPTPCRCELRLADACRSFHRRS